MKITANFVVAFLTTLMVIGCAKRNDTFVKELPKRKTQPVPAYRPTRLNDQLREDARAEIERAFAESDPIFRANAIEAAQEVLGDGAKKYIMKGLVDEQPLVRFASAMAAGQLRLVETRSLLNDLVNDASKRVRIGARFALHRLGDTTHSHDLEIFARDPEPPIRADTAVALGLLEDKSALNILRVMANDADPLVRMQVAEAMWRLGDEEGLQSLLAGLVSKFPDDQIVCVLALAGPRDRRVIQHLRGKLSGKKDGDWDEVSLAAARALGQIGSDEGVSVALRGIRSADPRIRGMSALALGAIGRSDVQSSLGDLLKDRQASVRIAAAMAILQLKSPVT